MVIPEGIYIEYLLPYSPEQQRAERLWSVADEPLAIKVLTRYKTWKKFWHNAVKFYRQLGQNPSKMLPIIIGSRTTTRP